MPRETICENCGAKLCTEAIPVGRDSRCAKCGAINELDWAESGSGRSSGAGWSLLLGVASFLSVLLGFGLSLLNPQWWHYTFFALALFVGIAAVVVGFRSLNRMKYLRTSGRKKAAAISGTLLGSFFGIFCGGLISMAGLFIGLISLNTTVVRGVDSCLPLSRQLLLIDFPEDSGIEPYQLTSMLSQIKIIRYRNAPKPDEADLYVQVCCFPRWATHNFRMSLENLLRDFVYSHMDRSELKDRQEQTLDWNVTGEKPETRKMTWKWEPDLKDTDGTPREGTVRQYYSMFNDDVQTIGMVVVVHPENTISEEDVKRIFESIRFPQ